MVRSDGVREGEIKASGGVWRTKKKGLFEAREARWEQRRNGE